LKQATFSLLLKKHFLSLSLFRLFLLGFFGEALPPLGWFSHTRPLKIPCWPVPARLNFQQGGKKHALFLFLFLFRRKRKRKRKPKGELFHASRPLKTQREGGRRKSPFKFSTGREEKKQPT
jgi:hypothetical protein